MGTVKVPATSRAVLLVQDNRDDAMFFHRAFRAAGFENPLHIVKGGEEAIRYFKGEAQYADRAGYPLPHLVVIDTSLHGASGFELLEWMRQQPQFKKVAAIVLSGGGRPDEQEKAARLDANAYHRKPASPGEFQALIGRIAEFWLLGGPSAE